MMGGALLPDDMHGKVSQMDGLVMNEINDKYAMHDMYMFGTNPKWTRNLYIWGEARVETVGKDSKTGEKGVTMMFIGYSEQESDSIRMWDPQTATITIIVAHDVIWLKHMHFQPDDITGVLELENMQGIVDGIEEVHADNATYDMNVTPQKSGGSVTWNHPVVTIPTASRVTQSGQILKPPERLTCAPAVELRYLGEMAELDHAEL